MKRGKEDLLLPAEAQAPAISTYLKGAPVLIILEGIRIETSTFSAKNV